MNKRAANQGLVGIKGQGKEKKSEFLSKSKKLWDKVCLWLNQATRMIYFQVMVNTKVVGLVVYDPMKLKSLNLDMSRKSYEFFCRAA